MAVLAIWLTVLAPVVSRAMPAESPFPDLGAWCEGGGLVDRHSPASPDQHADHLAKCGYCSLLNQQPGLAGVGFVATLPPLSVFVPAFTPVHREARTASPLAASPRGPPLFLDA
jgi:hypothetical protein